MRYIFLPLQEVSADGLSGAPAVSQKHLVSG